MIRQKMITFASVAALLALALAFVLIQLGVGPRGDWLDKIFALAIYGLLIMSYVLQIVLIVLGLFAAYRLLWERTNRRYADD